MLPSTTIALTTPFQRPHTVSERAVAPKQTQPPKFGHNHHQNPLSQKKQHISPKIGVKQIRSGRHLPSTPGVFNPSEFRSMYDDKKDTRIPYEYGAIYSDNGQLTKAQQWLSNKIWNYQGNTRFNPDPNSKGRKISAQCPFPHQDRLSCSEYGLIAIHKLGAAKGTLATLKRLSRCTTPSALINNLDLGGYNMFIDPIKTYKTDMKAEQAQQQRSEIVLANFKHNRTKTPAERLGYTA